ncbi:MAG TPA: hypothetical protein DCQ42_15015 [Halomonas sp.]|nr:hypothetical protein [uncultured Halomonas sp.]HAO02982.1 hypothetical protein [Halomonas sp.]|tara:strand:- start:56 stop:424 length:369 start_codon:yes stop_codon:yes gene_type:complete
MTSTAFDDQFAVCTPEEEEAFRAIEARQREAEIVRPSQRERFERWFSDQGKWPQSVERSGEGYRLMQAQSAWETWKIACPEGWQAVPVEPTDEMLDSAPYPGCAAIETWREMRSAAPEPGDA